MVAANIITMTANDILLLTAHRKRAVLGSMNEQRRGVGPNYRSWSLGLLIVFRICPISVIRHGVRHNTNNLVPNPSLRPIYTIIIIQQVRRG